MSVVRLSADQRSAAVDDGMEAYVAGRLRDDNPYQVGHPLRMYWDRGWMIGAKHGHAT